MNIIFFGFKRCGKTYYGLKAAQHFHMPFLDSDLLVEEHYNKLYNESLNYREIAQKRGFPFYRDLERQVISDLMQQKNSIISLGGGVVLDPENVTRLEQIGVLVYLKTSKETLAHRLLSSDPPAYIDPKDPVGSFNKMYEERLPIYEGIQADHIDMEGLPEDELLKKICLFVKKIQEKEDGE